MEWYLCKLIFKIETDAPEIPLQFDEQWRLIEATDQDTAYMKAKALGANESESFRNSSGTMVHWKFVSVTQLNLFGQADDGAELFSRVEVPDNHHLYLHSIKMQADSTLDQLNQSNTQA